MPAAELRARLGVSPATLMRAVRHAETDVVRIGRARATRYGLRQAWPLAAATRFPLIRVGEDGTARAAGELVTLAGRQSVVLPDGIVADGLPRGIADARPAGFLGRHFASVHADLHLPERLSDWSEHHSLLAMARRGHDLAGNLIVGDESFARWQRLEIAAHGVGDYPALADATMAGHPPESWAGGERPKFGTFDGARHVLVKFAARGQAGGTVARRWHDLLLLEALALEIVAAHGIAAARTRAIDGGSHVFLESERFDRAGARGRVAVVSLAAVHDDPADAWARAATVLRGGGRISAEDARALRWLDAFGALIANTDRHQRNVLFFDGEAGLRLAPAFGQVPVLYAPTIDGQLPVRAFAVPPATADTLDVWEDARAAAVTFWQRAAADSRISDKMRMLAVANAVMLAR